MSTPPTVPILNVIRLEHGFADPAFTDISHGAVFRLRDGGRVELLVRGAIHAYTCEGPRVETHQLLIAPSSIGPSRHVELIQVHALEQLVGAPEALLALEQFSAGHLKDAARYAMAAGARWAALVDLFGGPA